MLPCFMKKTYESHEDFSVVLVLKYRYSFKTVSVHSSFLVNSRTAIEPDVCFVGVVLIWRLIISRFVLTDSDYFAP